MSVQSSAKCSLKTSRPSRTSDIGQYLCRTLGVKRRFQQTQTSSTLQPLVDVVTTTLSPNSVANGMLSFNMEVPLDPDADSVAAWTATEQRDRCCCGVCRNFRLGWLADLISCTLLVCGTAPCRRGRSILPVLRWIIMARINRLQLRF